MRSSGAADGADLMGRIERLAAAGIPRESLLQLSADLIEGGKAAQRVGALPDQLANWVRSCVTNPPGHIEEVIGFGLPSVTIAMLLKALADLGWSARACDVSDTLGNFAADFDLTMGLAGCRSVAEIDREAVTRAP